MSNPAAADSAARGSPDHLASLFRLDGQVALVTGATTGLGFEIAQALAGAGATLAVHGRDDARVRSAAARIRGSEAVVFDLNDAAAARAAVDGVVNRLGRLDVLVGNAGIRDRSAFLQTTSQGLRDVLETNLVANFELARLVSPYMLASGGGRIIFISTVGASRGPRLGSTYAASKAGLEALTRSLAVELGPLNIRVNAISPGFFATEFNEQLLKEPTVAETILKRVPLRRCGSPNEMVGPALFLASSASSYVNGQILVVDGGLTIAA